MSHETCMQRGSDCVRQKLHKGNKTASCMCGRKFYCYNTHFNHWGEVKDPDTWQAITGSGETPMLSIGDEVKLAQPKVRRVRLT